MDGIITCEKPLSEDECRNLCEQYALMVLNPLLSQRPTVIKDQISQINHHVALISSSSTGWHHLYKTFVLLHNQESLNAKAGFLKRAIDAEMDKFHDTQSLSDSDLLIHASNLVYYRWFLAEALNQRQITLDSIHILELCFESGTQFSVDLESKGIRILEDFLQSHKERDLYALIAHSLLAMVYRQPLGDTEIPRNADKVDQHQREIEVLKRELNPPVSAKLLRV